MRDLLEPVIAKHITSPSARAVALDLTSGLLVMERLARNATPDRDLRNDALRVFVSVFLDLPANPFWRDNAGYLSPLVAMACNAWLDAVVYARNSAEAEAANDTEGAAVALVRSVGLRASIVEIALAVLYCERGAGGLRDASHKFREALVGVLEP